MKDDLISPAWKRLGGGCEHITRMIEEEMTYNDSCISPGDVMVLNNKKRIVRSVNSATSLTFGGPIVSSLIRCWWWIKKTF